MAVGIIVGSSFVKIVDSLVNVLFNPLLGFLVGGIRLRGFSWKIRDDLVIEYGEFLNSIIDFFIIAFSVFLFVKGFNALKNRYTQPQKSEKKRTCPFCASEISLRATKCPYCTSTLEIE